MTEQALKTAYERHLRRAPAAQYIVDTYGVPCSPKTLAKLACVSSEGPPFDSRDASPFTLSQVSTPGRRERSARSFGAHRSCGASPKSTFHLKKEKPGRTRPWGGCLVRAGLQGALLSMSIYRKSHEEIQVSAGLPLFDWRPAVGIPLPALAVFSAVATSSIPRLPTSWLNSLALVRRSRDDREHRSASPSLNSSHQWQRGPALPADLASPSATQELPSVWCRRAEKLSTCPLEDQRSRSSVTTCWSLGGPQHFIVRLSIDLSGAPRRRYRRL